MSRTYFGTDGIRGTVGQPPITPDFMLRLGHAVGQVLRRAFPHFYAFVTGVAALAAGAWWAQDGGRAGALLLVAASAWLTRQVLMPAINRATDAGLRQRFQLLHGLSVLITLAHIAACAWLLGHLI